MGQTFVWHTPIFLHLFEKRVQRVMTRRLSESSLVGIGWGPSTGDDKKFSGVVNFGRIQSSLLKSIEDMGLSFLLLFSSQNEDYNWSNGCQVVWSELNWTEHFRYWLQVYNQRTMKWKNSSAVLRRNVDFTVDPLTHQQRTCRIHIKSWTFNSRLSSTS